ncbi:hypothetical protein D9619_005378 [Psilocybe cf. subviscida]|uniref:Alpha/beta hydrolase fold-3 domain-containing protein n=1 Tax=Psilocybe cf. subviscida TaxID=2480587 RepID=A0A8H5BZ14_9AGAR|nr:hypothetical protein D9619_005378 [Psilocybe cf. subviscida]
MSAPPNIKPTAIGAYKHIGPEKIPIAFNLYLPSSETTPVLSGPLTLPTVVYFHGGGLAIGDLTWFPQWLYDRVMSLGYAFISANYQLLLPGTVHDIIQDVQDLFIYLENSEVALDHQRSFRADMDRIAVAGSSSGGHCAYLAAMHCVPKPKAIFTMYPVGGSFFTPFYLKEKTTPFFMGQGLIDPAPLKRFLYPFEGGSRTPISKSAVGFDPVTKAPNNRRMAVPPLWIQLGVVLDYYNGIHEPSLSAKLRKVLEEDPHATSKDFEKAMPVSQRYTFPELNVSAAWPPTLSFHGDADTAVLVSESQNLTKLLKEAGVNAELMIASGQEHLFDAHPQAEEKWGKQFETAKDFFFKHLGKA